MEKNKLILEFSNNTIDITDFPSGEKLDLVLETLSLDQKLTKYSKMIEEQSSSILQIQFNSMKIYYECLLIRLNEFGLVLYNQTHVN